MGLAWGIGSALHISMLGFAGLIILGFFVGIFLGSLEWKLLVWLCTYDEDTIDEVD